MKWYEEHYVNRRDWVLDHLEYLALTPAELEIVMLIDFSSQYQLPISMDSLSSKSGMTMDEVNDAVSSLVARRYLTIRASGGNVAFRLDGLFSTDTAKEKNALDASLFETFESEFRRTLSQQEMEKISEWSRTYDKKLILEALRQASMYQKLNLPYVEKILIRLSEKGAGA